MGREQRERGEVERKGERERDRGEGRGREEREERGERTELEIYTDDCVLVFGQHHTWYLSA